MGSVVIMTEYQRRREGASLPRPGGAEIVVLPVVQQVRDQPSAAGEPRQQRF